MCAQTPPTRPHFEVASVRPTAKDETGGGQIPQLMRELGRNKRRPGEIPMQGPDRIRLKDWPLSDLIAAAYSVRANQVSGPTWLSDQGFDIAAKVPERTLKDELNAMLQSLLEERFSLKVHRATKTEQGFALTVGKDGPKLKSAEPAPAPATDLTEEERGAQTTQKMQVALAATMKRMQESGPLPGGYSTWPSITTEELAAQLVRSAGAPVVDETGLTGKYSVTITTWESADVPGGTLLDAVEKLGLELQPRKLTVVTVVVDQASKAPTPN